MRTECNYLLASGEKCQSPAVIGSSLCRHHHPRKRKENRPPFSLPPISDRSSLLAAIFEVLHAISECRISRRDAGTLLFGLQMAAKVMSDVEKEVEQALASGEDGYFDEPFSTESSRNQPREPRSEERSTIQSVEALLREMQALSIKPAVDPCQARPLTPPGKSRSEMLHSVRRTPS